MKERRHRVLERGEQDMFEPAEHLALEYVVARNLIGACRVEPGQRRIGAHIVVEGVEDPGDAAIEQRQRRPGGVGAHHDDDVEVMADLVDDPPPDRRRQRARQHRQRVAGRKPTALAPHPARRALPIGAVWSLDDGPCVPANPAEIRRVDR